MDEKLIKIEQPKIDIELCTQDNNLPPITKVYSMDEDSFEEFTNEWLYACYSSKYRNIQRIGGAGDKGRDVIATLEDNQCDYFQCKHYKDQLAPTDFYIEFGKLCYYTFKGDYVVPRKYYIVASHDIGPSLKDLLSNQSKLKQALIDSWENYCKPKLGSLSNELQLYIENFDFSIIEHFPIQKIIDEHIKTVYGKIRFGGFRISIPNKLNPPDKIDDDELPYVNALLDAYSDDSNKEYSSVKDIENDNRYLAHFNRQRKDYYAIETVRRFVRDTFTNSDEFECLKNEIYDGIIDVHEEEYENGLKRLSADLEQAVKVNVSSSLLDSKLHIIKNEQRKGVCHLLVEDKNINWVKK